MRELNETANKLLDAAEHYTQMQGFNAFSYKDIQNDVGVKTSSIHYYFPTKNDLALCMTERYIERSRKALKTVAKENACGEKRLEILGKVYTDILNENQFCLCGMLASDILTLPEIITSKLDGFFRFNEEWVADAIEQGIDDGKFRSEIDSESCASQFMAMLEGGMLIARVQKNTKHLELLISNTIDSYK